MNAHRIKAFCDWLDSIPPDPPFHQHHAFRFFSYLSEAEIAAAQDEMYRRAVADVDASIDLMLRSQLERQRGEK